jgi:nucleotide-binding universal stress UspA family protein
MQQASVDESWQSMATQPGGGAEHRIVVGVDGSVPSNAALAWAVTQARLTGSELEAVTAWDFPATYGFAVPVTDVDLADLATEVSDNALAGVAASAGQLKITRTIRQGNAAQVLIEESAGANLLVIGSRGHGGFVEALLGSVGQHCVHHATCPVVVIRDSVTGAPSSSAHDQ